MTPAQQSLVEIQSNSYTTLADMFDVLLPILQDEKFIVQVTGDEVTEAMDDDMICTMTLYFDGHRVCGMYLGEDYHMTDDNVGRNIPAKCVRIFNLAHQQDE